MLKKLSQPNFKSPATVPLDWDNFRGGWNNLLRQTELNKNELALATNLMLKGLGVPTKRWGTEDYFMGSPTGYGRGVFSIKSAAGVSELLSISDWGIMVKKNGASYTPITGVSWASGYNMSAVQLYNKVYFTNGQRELTRYDFSSLVGFPTLSRPGGVSATNFSGATGTRVVAYRITATSRVGESAGSDSISLATLPQVLANTQIHVQWTPVSAASGDLTGYNVYRGDPGDETLLTSVGNEVTKFIDYGLSGSRLIQPPTADTTGGPVAKYIIRFQDRLVMAGIPGNPTKVLISGRAPYHERFDASYGGGDVLVAPDEGQDITGLAVVGERIIVTKEKSLYEITLNIVDVGNESFLEPIVKLLTSSQGCSSHYSIVAVDNDLFFANREGIYVLGYEPNILNVLRTNELSAKIRTFFESLSYYDIQNCSAEYHDRKYVLTFPNARRTIIFDRERAAFMGPWPTPFGMGRLLKHVDTDGTTRLVASDSSDNFITLFNPMGTDDKGTAFATALKTKREQFGAWELFKTMEDIYFQFRSVTGSVNINILLENRDGVLESAKSLTVNGAAQLGQTGWGTDLWGTADWGDTNNDPGTTSDELPKRTILSKDFRSFQIEVSTENAVDNYELLGIRSTVRAQGPGSVPYLWNT